MPGGEREAGAGGSGQTHPGRKGRAGAGGRQSGAERTAARPYDPVAPTPAHGGELRLGAVLTRDVGHDASAKLDLTLLAAWRAAFRSP